MFQKLGKNQELSMIKKTPLPVCEAPTGSKKWVFAIIPGIGFFSDGITITALERTIAGAINETNDKSG